MVTALKLLSLSIVQFKLYMELLVSTMSLMLLSAYLYYTYKLYKNITSVAILEGQQSLFHKVSLAMGTLVGLSYVTFVLHSIFNLSPELYALHGLSVFLAQHCVIVAIFLCSKKICRLYREYLCAN